MGNQAAELVEVVGHGWRQWVRRGLSGTAAAAPEAPFSLQELRSGSPK